MFHQLTRVKFAFTITVVECCLNWMLFLALMTWWRFPSLFQERLMAGSITEIIFCFMVVARFVGSVTRRGQLMSMNKILTMIMPMLLSLRVWAQVSVLVRRKCLQVRLRLLSISSLIIRCMKKMIIIWTIRVALITVTGWILPRPRIIISLSAMWLQLNHVGLRRHWRAATSSPLTLKWWSTMWRKLLILSLQPPVQRSTLMVMKWVDGSLPSRRTKRFALLWNMMP